MLTLRLTATAKRDIARVLRRTKDEFGEHQARRYPRLIERGIERISELPWLGRFRLRTREIRFLHLKQPGHDAAHYLVYEVHHERIDILRLMHERQDEVKALTKLV
jgi:plasmid stabilization system protein ParE